MDLCEVSNKSTRKWMSKDQMSPQGAVKPIRQSGDIRKISEGQACPKICFLQEYVCVVLNWKLSFVSESINSHDSSIHACL